MLICFAIILFIFTFNNKSIKPSITTVKDIIYLNNLTLNDPTTQVIERMGEKYEAAQEDGSGADYVMIYDENIRIYIVNNHIDKIIVKDVNLRHFENFFISFEGIKFTNDRDRYIYSKPSEQLIKATTNTPNEKLYLYFMYPDDQFYNSYNF